MYSAYVLQEKSRKLLASVFAPVYPQFVGHHVTHIFGEGSTDLPPEAKMHVVGYATDRKGLECFVVSVNGTIERPDGGIYHLTWSLDRANGRKPFQSILLLEERGFALLHRDQYITLEAEPAVCH